MLAPTEKKEFRSLVVASAATGVGLCEGLKISQFAEVYEFVLGHPVWTHELPSYGPKVREILSEQFPLMPTSELAHENYAAAAEAMTAAYGEKVFVRPGFGERTKSPIDTLAEIVGPEKIIVVKA